MDSDLKSKRQVSSDQLNGLLKFLTQHQELAKGLARGRGNKYNTLKLWNQCAKKLNVIEDGAVKDGKGWSKYWCDWKYRVKRRALEQKAAKDNNRPLPDGFTNITPLEGDILKIIGESSIDSVIIKTDPLAERESDCDLDTIENNDTESVHTFAESRSNRKRRRNSSKNFNEFTNFGESSKQHASKHNINMDQCQDDSDNDSCAIEFLRLEKEKLENSKIIQQSVQTIATQVTRLADIMDHIKEVLINNNRVNI